MTTSTQNLLTALLLLASPTAMGAPSSEEEPTWDISDAHGPTHEAQIEVDEGTWMSVSVHQDTIVFDLLGDLWTIPMTGGEAIQLTSGPAWDSEARFSPDGTKIAFVSDRDGNEQIWRMDVPQPDPENPDTLIHSDPVQVTHENEARFTDPVWDPNGPWLIVRKRTVDTRSIGVTELWQVHIDGGEGFALTSLDSHPHAGESTLLGDDLWFSSRSGRFTYDQDPLKGLWSIMRLDRTTGEMLPVVSGLGSAARPTISPDGTHLAFVSRDQTDTLLEVLDTATGQRRTIADWLDHDQMEGFALHGVYPSMAWIDNDGTPEIVCWAGGKLWRLNLAGERVEIPFSASGTWRFHDVPRNLRAIEDEVQAKVIRWPTQNAKGSLAFSAMGILWVRDANGTIRRVSEGTGYAPAWDPSGKVLAWTSWNDGESSSETAAIRGTGRLHFTKGKRTSTMPLQGQLVNPTWGTDEDGKEIMVVLRGGGGNVTVDMASEPWYEIVLIHRPSQFFPGRRQPRSWAPEVIGTTKNRGSSQRASNLRIHEGRVWYLETRHVPGRKPSETVLLSIGLDGKEKQTHLSFPGAAEIVISPDFTKVAYKQDHQVWVTAMPMWGQEVAVNGDALPKLQITEMVGDWLQWSADGTQLSWMEGAARKTVSVDSLQASEEEAEDDEVQDADDAQDTVDAQDTDEAPDTDKASDQSDVETDTIDLVLPRAKPTGKWALTHAKVVTMDDSIDGDGVLEDATILIEGDRIISVEEGVGLPAGANELDCTGMTIIPGLIDVHAHMHFSSGDVLPSQDWKYQTSLDFGVTTIHDPSASTDLVFTQAERVEAGFMDGPRIFSTGAVLYGALSNGGAKTPDKESAFTHVERLSTVGASSVKVYQQSRRDQRQWYVQACNETGILCIAEGGGDIWMNLGMMADGMHAVEHALPIAPLYADVHQFVTASQGGTVSKPNKNKISKRGTAYTPTLLVAYGGLSGEHYFYQHHHPLTATSWPDEAALSPTVLPVTTRLLQHYPRRQLQGRTWRTAISSQEGDWNHQEVARQAALLQRNGSMVTLGAHGQLQGLGVHWELWALGGPGAMTPIEALSAATIEGARYLGLEKELGSIEPGKLADLVVIQGDPTTDIHHSVQISTVIKNGVVWE